MNDNLAEIAENLAKPCQKASQPAWVKNVTVAATAANSRPAELSHVDHESR